METVYTSQKKISQLFSFCSESILNLLEEAHLNLINGKKLLLGKKNRH